MAHENDWVADVLYYTREWTNISSDWSFSFDGKDVWTDGNDIYISCAGRSADYVLNKGTLLWETKSWTWEGGRPSPFGGRNIWTDGTDMYYSYGTTQYVLNKSENKWYKKTWTGNLTGFYGGGVWADGTNVYYSMGDQQYVLDIANSTWDVKTWNGMTNFYGAYIWSDGTNIYYSKMDQSSGQRVLNKATSTWETVTWYRSTGSTFNPDGQRIWTDGTDMYYSSSFDHYVLNKSDMKWYTKTWTGLSYISSGEYIWNYGEHVYYSYSSTQYELKKNTVTDIPYRLNFPELKESINPHDIWVADQHELEPDSWSWYTWSGFVPTYGNHIWSIGDAIYYSNGNSNNQYVLNKTNLTWERKTWSGIAWLYGYNIWTDGENYFYDDAEEGWHYALNQNTSTWSYKTWSGYTPSKGIYVWTDGESTYYSQGSSQYVLDKATSTWSAKTWNGLTSFDGNCVWADGETIYYSKGSAQYVLDKATSTWSEKTWNGLTSFDGSGIWRCGDYIFYSVGNTLRIIQCILDRTTSTWYAKSWNNSRSLNGHLVWTDGENIYSSNGQNEQSILNREIVSSVPYRSNFPEMIESADLHDKWVTEIDPDAPVSAIEFDPNYRYVKLEFDYTVALNTTLTSESATTDLPNSGINISSGGGYWWQRWLEIRPKTPVASRLYAAEFAIKEDNGLSDYYTNYLIQMEKGHNNGDISAMSFAMEPRAAGYSANTADLAINGSAYTSDTNTVYYNNSTAQIANLNNQVGVIIRLDQNSDEPEVKSGTVTCKLYYCFDSDESGYEALLAAYPNHASPYSPAPVTKVPYRLDFPPLIESIDLDSWLIDDDIPFRINFPELKESVNPYDEWLIDDDIPFRWNFPKLIESSANPVRPPSYFTFKGRSSAEFGSIEILPLCLKHEEKTDFINFIYGNPYVSETSILRSKVITITLNLSDISPANIDRVNAWLIGTGKLVLSHDPHRYYIATCNNALTGQKLVNTLGKVAVQFNVMPYKYDLKEKDTFEPADLAEEALHKTAAIYYKGSAPAESTFKITATGNIEIYNVQTEKIVEIKGLTEYCIIDIKARKVTDESNLNILNRTYGDIFDLMLVPGYNYFFLSGSVTAVEVKKKTRWY